METIKKIINKKNKKAIKVIKEIKTGHLLVMTAPPVD